MDLARTGFETPFIATLSVKVDTDASGNLVTDSGGVAVAGSKRISFNNIYAEAEENDITAVTTAFLRTLPGTGSAITEDDTETTITAKWEAA